MTVITRFTFSLLLIAALLSNALPCGPGYITPLFDTGSAPENPFTDFAAGRLGILKPGFRRSVLYAAYRHVAGTGMSSFEQKEIVERWKAEINNSSVADTSVDAAVRSWIEKRGAIVGKEEKLPEIYTERNYGGYDFFPNCTQSSFETAAETLSDRISSNGSTDPNVLSWIAAQDQVFANCATGKQTPAAAPAGAPDWLKKDRAYQIAAASFYSLDYDDAKRRFAEIAQDISSPWQETADYLVARTLIRQASLTKSAEKSNAIYDEAEAHLQRFTSGSGKFAASVEGLSGLIKYRRHPKERVSELAKKLVYYGGNDTFIQDLVDYTWLLDKFESEALTKEQKRKDAEKAKNDNGSNSNSLKDVVSPDPATNSNKTAEVAIKNDGDITIYLSTDDYQQNWVLHLAPSVTDDEAVAAAEALVGSFITDDMRNHVRESRRSAYAGRFSEGKSSGYEADYYGEDKLTPSLMPQFLQVDELTDWLFTFQMGGTEPYLYSLNKFRETGSELWLMTALSKAEASSTGLTQLLDATERTSRTSPAYVTIAFHTARLLIDQKKPEKARELVDSILESGDQLPISARNSFLGFKLRFAETMDDYLTYSLRRPFAFDLSGSKGTIDEFIAQQKLWYDPENDQQTREVYEAEVEDRFKSEKDWQDRVMFDADTIEVFNQHFPTSVLFDVLRSPKLPDYMRERFAVAVWTRAYLLNDTATFGKVTPELLKYRPEFEPFIIEAANMKTPAARENAWLYFVLKNPLLSPFLEGGLGKADNEFGVFDSNDWWCEPYDLEYDYQTDSEKPKALPTRPPFLSETQSRIAQNERKRLRTIGDAPKYLAGLVLAWEKRSTGDKRVPEALYLMISANGWTKYGCGNNETLRNQMAQHLRKNYPNSEWTATYNREEAGE